MGCFSVYLLQHTHPHPNTHIHTLSHTGTSDGSIGQTLSAASDSAIHLPPQINEGSERQIRFPFNDSIFLGFFPLLNGCLTAH